MATKPYALTTLADLKDYLPVEGTGRDAILENCINRASLIIEGFLDRRLVYRAPPEVEGAGNIKATATIANGALAGISQPSSDGRTLIYTVTDADRGITAGTITTTGTVAGVAGVTEVVDLANGLVQHGTKFFTAISSIVVANVATIGAGDTLAIGTSLGYVEYHTVQPESCELRLCEQPVRQVLSVYEDLTGTYPAATLLTAATAYSVNNEKAILTRLYSGLPWSWYRQWRAVKVTYSAGYFSSANVPADIKFEAQRLAGLLFQETEKGRLGLSSVSDTGGNFTRFAAAGLARESKETLGVYMRAEIFGRTGERLFDLEAA